MCCPIRGAQVNPVARIRIKCPQNGAKVKEKEKAVPGTATNFFALTSEIRSAVKIRWPISNQLRLSPILVMFRFNFDIGPDKALGDPSNDFREPSGPSTTPDLPQGDSDLEPCNEVLIQDLVRKKFAKGGYWVTRTALYASFQGNRHSSYHRALG